MSANDNDDADDASLEGDTPVQAFTTRVIPVGDGVGLAPRLGRPRRATSEDQPEGQAPLASGGQIPAASGGQFGTTTPQADSTEK
jgi:hypothetical protein